MRIEKLQTGFIEVPNTITINVYANGCKLRCNGCSNPQLLSFDGGIDYTTDDLIRELRRFNGVSNTVCWLGGDASYQESDFIEFNKKLKSIGYNTVLYTGRFIEDIGHLINDVDIVVDSPWQGVMITEEDTNQRIFIKEELNWKQITYKELKTKQGDK